MNQAISTAELKQGKAYSPDLTQMLSQCELNYLLAQRIWPAFFENAVESTASNESGNAKSCDLLEASSEVVRLVGSVSARARYTTTVDLVIEGPETLGKPIELIVRFYHDAKMLEVMEGTGPGALKAVYLNDKEKKHTDEKRQINQFLGECLRACLKK